MIYIINLELEHIIMTNGKVNITNLETNFGMRAFQIRVGLFIIISILKMTLLEIYQQFI